MCQICTQPKAKSATKSRVDNAIPLSARIIMRRLFERSTTEPAIGPRNMKGSIPTKVAVANTVAEPVCFVRYQIKANCTSWLPNKENAWPLQTRKKGFFQFFPISVNGLFVIFQYGLQKIHLKQRNSLYY